VPKFEELDLKLGPLLGGVGGGEDFEPCKTVILDQIRKQVVLTWKKRGTDLETKLLEVRHMS
jgi:hypothetical protein